MRFLVAVALSGLVLASPAHAEWWEARTDHFIVYSESPEAEARQFSEKLERLDMALRSVQGIKFKPATSDAHRLTVFRSGDIDDIGRLYGSSGVAGFYIPRLEGSVAFTPSEPPKLRRPGELTALKRDARTELYPEQVLYHEYAHHFMFQHFSAAYPSWYVEGFAETIATIDLRPDGSFHLGNPPNYRSDAFDWINISVKRMIASNAKPTGESFYSYYVIGWLLNHYLSFEPSRAGQLQKYLQLINSGSKAPDAAVQAFGDLDKLNSELYRYKSGQLLGADVRIANYAPPSVTMRRLAPDEEAAMKVRMRTKALVNKKRAGDIASDARALAAKYPNSFAAQLVLARGELDQAEFDPQNYARAEAAADRALALKPDSIEAMLYKGRVHLELGKTDKSHMPIARTWFARARDEDTQHPAPLYYNYLTYHHSGDAIPETALIGLEHAFGLAPYDDELRLVLARQLLAEKKGDLGRAVLMPFAISPHESKGAKKMREVVDLIEASKVTEAHTLLATEMAEQERKRKKGDDED